MFSVPILCVLVGIGASQRRGLRQISAVEHDTKRARCDGGWLGGQEGFIVDDTPYVRPSGTLLNAERSLNAIREELGLCSFEGCLPPLVLPAHRCTKHQHFTHQRRLVPLLGVLTCRPWFRRSVFFSGRPKRRLEHSPRPKLER